MIEHLEFIEAFAIDKCMYWKLKSNDHEIRWELFWNPSFGSTRQWALRPSDSELPWTYLNKFELIEQFHHSSINKISFLEELTCNIKTMVVFSELLKKEATSLVGEHGISEMIQEWRIFSSNLTKMVQEKLSLATTEEPEAERHLRLIE